MQIFWCITKTCLYNFDPLKSHLYIVKLGFAGVYIIFLISAQNIDSGYSLEPPRRGGSNEYPQSMYLAEICKISGFLSENFQFLVVKFSIYLNRRVFVMDIVRRMWQVAQPIYFSCHEMVFGYTKKMRRQKNVAQTYPSFVSGQGLCWYILQYTINENGFQVNLCIRRFVSLICIRTPDDFLRMLVTL